MGDDGALSDVLRGGAVTSHAADVLADASGVVLARNSDAGALRSRSGVEGSDQGGDLGVLRASTNAGRVVDEGHVDGERPIRGSVHVSGGEDVGGTGDFDASLVTSLIRQRQAAIKRCYENELRNTPTLAGKVTIRFTIETSGTVSGVGATENTTGSATLASCVASTVGRFRFVPGPSGGSVSYAYPFVFAPQQ